jgi:RNA polymerase sigma-70 factor (ECF subfamily)
VGTDRELLAAWRAGDRQAGSALFERHFAELYRFFRNKVDDDVDDLIQQTLLACVRGLDGFRADASFRTWLFTIARNELYDHWRARRANAPAADVGEISVADAATSPSRAVARRREHQLLLAALRTLPLDLQVALELYYWEGIDGPELADVLAIPEGTARSRLRRGKDLLAARLGELTAAGGGGTVSVAELDAWAAEIRDGLLPAG